MFARPTVRVAGPVLWAFAAPTLCLVLWQLARVVLPSHGLWALPGAAAIVIVLGLLPFFALRRSMQEQHTWGVIVGAFSLGWALLVAIGGGVVLAAGADPSRVIDGIAGPRG